MAGKPSFFGPNMKKKAIGHRLRWSQELFGDMNEDMADLSHKERCAYIEDWLRDFNLGTNKLNFKVTDVRRVPRSPQYFINVMASARVAGRLISSWSDGHPYYFDDVMYISGPHSHLEKTR